MKVLRTAEFVPYVVFIEAPDFETLRAMNRAALESGVSTKQLTVRESELLWWWQGPWWWQSHGVFALSGVVELREVELLVSDLFVPCEKEGLRESPPPKSEMEPGTQNFDPRPAT